jgi:hypothetical protein
MEKLEDFQRKFLRGLATSMKPVVFGLPEGIAPAMGLSTENTLD